MKEYHLFYAPDIRETNELPTDEAAHAVRVLRIKEGDSLLATDGHGMLYKCTVALASPKHCSVTIERSFSDKRLWKGHIHLAVAPTKNMDRMEWLAEKATEIGMDNLALLDCKNSERHIIKTERIEKIVVSAMKQSHKAWKPRVEDMTSFTRFISQPFDGQKFIAHCYEDEMSEYSQTEKAVHKNQQQNLQKSSDSQEIKFAKPFLAEVLSHEGGALVLIGPEGDFSIDEVRQAEAAGFQAISLGDSRLRTETAALVAVHIMNLVKSERKGISNTAK